MKAYKHLAGYIERWTLFNKGRLHIRVQNILSEDKTPFLHTHPYAYLSIMLSGGYTEQLEDRKVVRKRWSFAFRSSKTFHRIDSVEPNTKTLFITWKTKSYDWKLKRVDVKDTGWIEYPPGVYQRNLYGRMRYCKFDQYWYVACDTNEEAMQATKASIDQTTKPS